MFAFLGGYHEVRPAGSPFKAAVFACSGRSAFKALFFVRMDVGCGVGRLPRQCRAHAAEGGNDVEGRNGLAERAATKISLRGIAQKHD